MNILTDQGLAERYGRVRTLVAKAAEDASEAERLAAIAAVDLVEDLHRALRQIAAPAGRSSNPDNL